MTNNDDSTLLDAKTAQRNVEKEFFFHFNFIMHFFFLFIFALFVEEDEENKRATRFAACGLLLLQLTCVSNTNYPSPLLPSFFFR